MTIKIPPERKKLLEANIWKYKLFAFLQLFMLFGALLNVYYLDLKFSLFQIMILGSLIWLVSFLFEVPSGAFSDLYGRKTSLIVASTAFFLGITFLAFMQNFYLLLIVSVISGIKLSFRSGSDSALLYDTLKELKREKEYPKISGRAVSLYLFGAAISAPIGSIIAKYTSIQYTIFLTIFVALLSLIVTVSFTEPNAYKRSEKAHLFSHMRESFSICMNNKKLKWLIILFASLTATFMISSVYIQMFLQAYGVDIVWFGLLLAIFLLGSSASSHLYGKIHSMINDMKLFKFMAYAMPVCLMLIAFGKSALIFVPLMFLIEIIYGLQMPTQQHYINLEIESKYRATVLSLFGMLSSILIAIISPITGLIGDAIGINYMFLILGAGSLLVFGLALSKLTKHYA